MIGHSLNLSQSKVINFRSITDNFDTPRSAGGFFFYGMVSVNQMECDLLAGPTKTGLAAAMKVNKVILGFIPTLYRWIPEANK